MIRPPPGLSAFEFVVLASLRTPKLTPWMLRHGSRVRTNAS